MYQDEVFEKALEESQQKNYTNLKGEVKTLETVIEKFLTQLLESTTTISERDFNVCGI